LSLDYQAYLASREWAVRKRAVRERADGQCERCRFLQPETGTVYFKPMYAVHHLTYAHIGNEPLEDLQAVCRECHDFLSAVADQDPIQDARDAQIAGAILAFVGEKKGVGAEQIIAALQVALAAFRSEGQEPSNYALAGRAGVALGLWETY